MCGSSRSSIAGQSTSDAAKNHMEGPTSFPVLLGQFVISGHAKIVEDEIRFWNGAKIFLCHCKDEKDRFKYLGAEIHVLLVDELTTFTETIYRFLRSRMRAPGLVIPDWAIAYCKQNFGLDLALKIPMALCGSNPGNIGHQWVKASWIDKLMAFEVKRMPKSEGGMLRQFVPAILEDNPHVNADEYEGKRSARSSPSRSSCCWPKPCCRTAGRRTRCRPSTWPWPR